MPTIKQMKVRMNSGHRLALESVRDGKKLDIYSDGEWRGYRKVFTTLRAWRAIDDTGLTDIGRQLLS